MSDKIKELVSKMTLEEKAAMITGVTWWTTEPIERLGIPELIMSDGPHGLRHQADPHTETHTSLPATCFPTASVTAATWDVDLIREMGEALGEECVAQDVDVLLGPGVNMKRSPLCGRNFEYFSEDPFLAGEMAASLINGIQSKGIGTSLKHFAVNNQEFQRFCISAEVDERTLREIYLTAFEKAVKQAHPWTVMCSYNKINGSYGSENYHNLTEILKGEWGFEGFVVSDWGAVHDRVASLKGGLDLEMPGPQPRRVKAVIEAVKAGTLDEALLDEAVRRILNITLRADKTPKGKAFDVEKHHALAAKIASEGMVLLKNNGILPLRKFEKIAVIGRSAAEAHYQGGGSSHINPTKLTVPFKEFQNRAGDAEVAYAQGYPADNSMQKDLINEAVTVAGTADVVVLYIALPTFKESEGYDRKDLDLTEHQVALIKAVSAVQPNTVVVLNNGAPVTMSAWIGGVAAVLEGYMMGQAGGIAIADILFGKVNPCGKLAETFPMRLEDTPAYINWPGGAGKVNYGEGLFIGYRYYDARKIPVQFPFGYGLSYTTFEYSNAKVSKKSFKDSENVTVSVDVTNTGKLTGKEIVQLYVHDQKSGLVRPEKELKGFAKVELKPGETKTVTIPLDFRSFAYYHPAYKMWITEDGEFDLLIGASSADIRQTLTVSLKSTVELPCILNMESTIREWSEDKRGKVVFGKFYNEVMTKGKERFGGEGSEADMGMDVLDMFGDMPLVSVLLFIQEQLNEPAEDLVAGLLAEVHQKK
jgi:beta-glucosidase